MVLQGTNNWTFPTIKNLLANNPVILDLIRVQIKVRNSIRTATWNLTSLIMMAMDKICLNWWTKFSAQ